MSRGAGSCLGDRLQVFRGVREHVVCHDVLCDARCAERKVSCSNIQLVVAAVEVRHLRKRRFLVDEVGHRADVEITVADVQQLGHDALADLLVDLACQFLDRFFSNQLNIRVINKRAVSCLFAFLFHVIFPKVFKQSYLQFQCHKILPRPLTQSF